MINLRILVSAFLFLFVVSPVAKGQTELPIATQEDIAKDLETVVCKNDERLAAVRALFVEKGAAEGIIKTDTFGSIENLVVTIPGKTDEIVVVGAHYDRAGPGCGAIDNWTGIVIIANLFKTIKSVETEKTWVFVAFGQEELGLKGSKKMAKAIPKENRSHYCSMINFDSFGLGYPQAMGNISDKALIKLGEEVSEALGLPFGSARVNGNSDSSSFRDIDIPAISIHGLTNKWTEYLHTSKDKLKNINPASVYYGYRFGLGFAYRVEQAPCREEKEGK